MATMPLRQVAMPPRRATAKPRSSEAHWFFILGFFLAYALCRMLT
jgi:hypothetical protein